MSTNTVMGVFPFDEDTSRRFRTIVSPLVQTHTGLTYVDATSYYLSGAPKMELISRMIGDARLVIVDISVKNPNVFMELGIAYALNKPIVLLCAKEAWDGRGTRQWNRRPPFDIQGRELLIYGGDSDLKVRLGRHISDALYRTSEVALSWDSLASANHVKSSSVIELNERGRVWNASTREVNSGFVLAYRVKIHESVSGYGKNPDVRLYLASAPETYPCLVVVFPWQHSERKEGKLECIITYFAGTGDGSVTPQDESAYGPIPADSKYDGRVHPHRRLQQVAVRASTPGPLEYEVFLSCYWPNLVFESTLFEEEVDRLYVSLSDLRARGYPTHLKWYIGFESVNSRVSITDIRVKEVSV